MHASEPPPAEPRPPVSDEQAFLAERSVAVVGASRDRSKYGNRVLRAYLAHGYTAIPIHPREREVEGQPAFARLAALPVRVGGVSFITPPEVSAGVLLEALALGYRSFWFQPGSEHPEAIRVARDAGARVLAYGPCVLVALAGRAPGRP